MNTMTAESSKVVIVGAGIVGVSLARLLAARNEKREGLGEVILIDVDTESLPGSTGHAPGFVGQLNEIPVLTELARRSVKHYTTELKEGSFDVVGGLEVALSAEGKADLEKRHALAAKHNLKSQLLTADEAVQLAPHLIERTEVQSALYFPEDGTANAQAITAAEKEQAQADGVRLVKTKVHKILFEESPVATSSSHRQTIGVSTEQGDIHASTVIICTGIWCRQLLSELPVFPVAHPYVYSNPARQAARSDSEGKEGTENKMPFVRWPERHVYARDHGLRDGLGSYSHAPVLLDPSALHTTAYGEWQSSFSDVLRTALTLLPEKTSRTFSITEPPHAFNGIFSLTPDGKPLVGRTGHEGVYCAVAVWVTHAFGAAKLMSEMLCDEVEGQDEWMVDELAPGRFEGKDWRQLETSAAATYNDVYNKGAREA